MERETYGSVRMLMDKKAAGKARFIEAYFDDLENRINFLVKLYGMNRRNEALMLVCCYVEALGNRQSREPKLKAKNYCQALIEHGKNDIWSLVHPKQLKNVLERKPLFIEIFDSLIPIIEGFGAQLVEPQRVLDKLAEVLNEEQRTWLRDNMFKVTMSHISYERVRSDLVHDISGASISFSEMSYKGSPVPDLNFDMLHASLCNIFDVSRERALRDNKWWFEE